MRDVEKPQNKPEEVKPQLPDVKYPPPKKVPQDNTVMAGALKDIILAIQQQLSITTAQSQFNTQHNSKMLEKLIQAQERRDLNPALMAIPTFSRVEPDKCKEWIQSIKNICRQSGRPLRQELINKSKLLVQNFIQNPAYEPICWQPTLGWGENHVHVA